MHVEGYLRAVIYFVPRVHHHVLQDWTRTRHTSNTSQMERNRTDLSKPKVTAVGLMAVLFLHGVLALSWSNVDCARVVISGCMIKKSEI